MYIYTLYIVHILTVSDLQFQIITPTAAQSIPFSESKNDRETIGFRINSGSGISRTCRGNGM